MKPALRSAGALVALLALTAYFAEGLWASVCPPEMVEPGVEAVADADPAGPPCPMEAGEPASDPAPTHESGAPEHPRSGGPVCPLGPMGTGGGCVTASLPTAADQTAPSFDGVVQPTPSVDAARDLLLVLSLFRPPRA